MFDKSKQQRLSAELVKWGFKPNGACRKAVLGGFDSRALPPFYQAPLFAPWGFTSNFDVILT